MRAACCEATVLRNEVIAPDIRLLTVVWPDRDHAPHAGQFFTLRSWGADEPPFLSRPISVHRWNPDSSTIEFLYQVVGEIVAFLHGKQPCFFKLKVCGFHGAAERGHQQLIVGLCRISDIVNGFFQGAFDRMDLCNCHISAIAPLMSSMSCA